MSSVMQDQIPSSLVKVIKKISNYKINTVKLIPESSTSISPGQSMRVRMPANVLCDFDSLGWHTKVTTATENSNCPPIEAFISQLRLSLGGEIVDSINNYGDLFVSMSNISCTTPHQNNRYITSLAAKQCYVPVATATAATASDATLEAAAETGIAGAIGTIVEATPNTVTVTTGAVVQRLKPALIATATPQYAVASTWLGLLSSLGIVDTTFLPQMEIEIMLHGNNILAGAGANGTWSMSDMFFTVDTIQFTQYTESLLASLRAGSTISYEFTRWVNVTFGGGAASVFDHKLSIASSNLQRLWWTYKKSTYSTQAALTAGMHVPNYYVFTSQDTGLIARAICYVDEKQFPQYTQDVQNYGFFETLRSLGKHNDNNFDCLIESKNDYHVRKFLSCFNFCHKASKAGEISGLNTLGLSSNIRLSITCEDGTGAATNLAAAGIFLVFCETKAVLNVVNGRIIQVEL